MSVKGHYLLGQALYQLERYDESLKSLQTVRSFIFSKGLKIFSQAQSLATDQRRNFGEEIAQSIRLTKRKRWEVMENKRKLQEIELESYLINLVLKDNETTEVKCFLYLF